MDKVAKSTPGDTWTRGVRRLGSTLQDRRAVRDGVRRAVAYPGFWLNDGLKGWIAWLRAPWGAEPWANWPPSRARRLLMLNALLTVLILWNLPLGQPWRVDLPLAAGLATWVAGWGTAWILAWVGRELGGQGNLGTTARVVALAACPLVLAVGLTRDHYWMLGMVLLFLMAWQFVRGVARAHLLPMRRALLVLGMSLTVMTAMAMVTGAGMVYWALGHI